MSSIAPLTIPPVKRGNDHWPFLRDVLVFQLKMLLDNLRDIGLMPVSLGAAALDLFFRGEHQGSFFYQVLRWGKHSEEVIDVYSAVRTHQPEVNPTYTVDGVIARLEGVLARECEKGGTAASVKAAMDRAISQIQVDTTGPRDKALEALARAREKVRSHLAGDEDESR